MIPFLLPKHNPRRKRAKRIPTLWQRIRHLDPGGKMLCNMCGRLKMPQEYHTEGGDRKLLLRCWTCDEPNQALMLAALAEQDA